MQILYSETGSKGNCSVIESENGHILIIDAGIKYKTVDKAIGYRLHTADALLVTHAHKDHTKYIGDFANANIEVYADYDYCYSHYLSNPKKYILTVDVDVYRLNGFNVRPIPMIHTNADGAPCECYGFLILDKSTGEKMLWSTDTQFIKNKFQPLEFYCIECNYFEQNDYEGELDYINKAVEQRRVQSHMSFESCVKFLKMQDLSKCKEIHLLHLSTKMDDKERKSVVRKMKRALKNEIGGRNIEIYS